MLMVACLSKCDSRGKLGCLGILDALFNQDSYEFILPSHHQTWTLLAAPFIVLGNLPKSSNLRSCRHTRMILSWRLDSQAWSSSAWNHTSKVVAHYHNQSASRYLSQERTRLSDHFQSSFSTQIRLHRSFCTPLARKIPFFDAQVIHKARPKRGK